MAQRLQGRVALVTGGAQRVGRGICLGLAEAGADVVIHYNRSAKDSELLAEELRERGRRAWTLQADFGRSQELDTVIERAFEIAGKLDILVNSASIFDEDKFEDFVLRDLRENIEVNAWAPLALARQLVKRAERGHIVNLVDSRVVGYDWSHVAYHASKVLLELFTREMALQWAPRFLVNGIMPGLILPPKGKDQSYLEGLKEKLPLKRVGSAEAIADAVVYLTGSDFVTGQMLFVDGGRHLKGGDGG